ncbi:hypothetical protein IAD21_03387 [Abditibacteriota bacterium]|nr:hypothetical protein IAD21_03387 [Abditibacteriota bacterium]
MKPILFVFLGGALVMTAANAQFGRAQTTPRFSNATQPPADQIRTVASPLLEAPAVSTANSSLPLQDVVLFSSGVGYFGRSGQVDGDATVDLLVRAPQISDILKSLVLFDAKGHVDPVTYSIQDYIAARPTTTDLNIDPNSSPGAILRLLQGAQVRIERQSGTIEGRVVSVSTQQIKDGETLRTVESATILTATGMTTIRLDDVLSFTPLDRGLADKFAATLEKRANSLTRGLDTGIRPITLHFRGKGRRDVRAGYLLESPAWKTSYRLVLAPKTKPYLQGWAVVENPGDEDWQNVNLSLVSGRPISFIQDLATPVYIVRPVVAPQIIGSATPQTFGPGYGGQNDITATIPSTNRAIIGGNNGNQFGARSGGGQFAGGGFGGNQFGGGRGGFGGNNGGFNTAPLDEAAQAATQIEIQNQVDAQATGAQQGNLFVYAIDTKVSIPHSQAAMVPIVSENVDGEAISIIQSQNQIGALTAQNGFFLRNRSDLNLQGGPIAVYADGIYGGDALITNVSPGESRLIAYAVDLDLVIRLESSDEDEEIIAINSTEGTLQLTKKSTRVQKYAFRNKSSASKVILLQQPNEADWKLVDPKQLYEKSNDGIRFRLEVPAKKTLDYTINWEKPEVEVVALRELSPNQINYYTQFSKIAPDLKAKLLNIIALKKKANDLTIQRAAQENSLKDISDGQTRIRENMKALDRTSPLYKSYEAKLQTQETQIDKIEAEIDRLQTAETTARQAVEDAIVALGNTPQQGADGVKKVVPVSPTPQVATPRAMAGFGF